MKNWNTSKIGTAVAACAILAGALMYLGSPHGRTAASPVPDLLSSIPAGAPTVVYLDLAAARASSFYQHRPDKKPIALPNQDYADFVRSTGFDFEKDLDRVVLAAWPPNGSEQKKSAVIAEGRFNQAKIRDYASRIGKLTREEGHDVFLFPASDRTGTIALTFLDDRHVAIVEGTSISFLLAGHGNDPDDPVRERAARVDGAAAFVISRVPPVPDNVGAGDTPSTQLASLVRSVRWVTVAARPEGDNLRISLEGECDSSASAAELRSAMELLRMFSKAGLDTPKSRQSMDPAAIATLQNLLASADITQAAERVRILLEVTPDIFKLGDAIKPQ